ncbi:unnamed protein product, partial [Effrenium voratum]
MALFSPWPSPSPSFQVLRKFCERSEHLLWYLSSIEDQRSEELRHLGDVVYLDYAGAALYSRSQILATQDLLLGGFLANPHSCSESLAQVERSRDFVLQMFNVSRKSHTVIFTSGATQSLHLLGEHFCWADCGLFLYADESHTSVLGLRQFAGCFGSFALEDLPKLAEERLEAAQLIAGGSAPSAAKALNLVAFPGESNFSGLRPDLSAVAKLRAGASGGRRWRVLLDAAKLAMTGLDLCKVPADFAVVSFYKIFGYPTGLGALVVRQDAAHLLQPGAKAGAPDSAAGGEGEVRRAPYFGGGAVASISARSEFFVPRPCLSEWLERGTLNFQGIAALPRQLAALRRLAPDLRRKLHAQAVCREAFLRTRMRRHSNGLRLSRIFGAHEEARWSELQGPTLALVLFYADGSPIPYGLVHEEAKKRNILLRVGCHCNAGACQRYLNLSDADVRHFYAAGKVCGDNLGLVDGRHTGVVRLSFGLFSTLKDVGAWLKLLDECFVDATPEAKEAAGVVREARTECLPSSPVLGHLCSLKVYPVKGCGPLCVRRWPLEGGGFFLDRRWCLVLEKRSRPVSAKQAPRLTTVKMALRRRHGLFVLVLSTKFHPETLELALTLEDSQVLQSCLDPTDFPQEDAVKVPEGKEPSAWFEELLDLRGLRLTAASACGSSSSAGTGEAPPAGDARKRDFANAEATLLLVSTASLRDFGRVCGLAVPSDRFRANLEVDFQEPYEEARWPEGLALSVGSVGFEAAGRCVRCQAVDIDPE